MAGDGKLLENNIEGFDAKYGRLQAKGVRDQPNEYPVNDGMMVIDLMRQDSSKGWNAKERKKPIFSPFNLLFQEIRIYKMPTGFEVMHLPKGFNLDNGFFSFDRSIESTDDSIKITDTRRMRRVELPVSEYPKIKEFYKKLPSRTEQRIILKKKGS